jgi:DNA-binding YbaB/EbfC family protein
MQQLMKQAQKMQAQVLAAQEQLASTELTGTAGGGLVEATVSGAGEVLRVKIDPKAVDPDDVESLEDLVLAAVRHGQEQAHELGAQTKGPMTGGLAIPGLEVYEGAVQDLIDELGRLPVVSTRPRCAGPGTPSSTRPARSRARRRRCCGLPRCCPCRAGR